MKIDKNKSLEITDIVRVARLGEVIEISKRSLSDIDQSNLRLVNIIKTGKPVFSLRISAAGLPVFR